MGIYTNRQQQQDRKRNNKGINYIDSSRFGFLRMVIFLFNDIKMIYRENNFYDLALVSLTTSLSIFLVFYITTFQLSYFYKMKGTSKFGYVEIMLTTILFVISLLLILKPRIHLSRDKKLLLVLGIGLSLFITGVIL